MKNKLSTTLSSIKTNSEIVKVLKSGKKINLPYITLWIKHHQDKTTIYYGLLVNKTQFKLAVIRNKIKRQLREILIGMKLSGGINILLKPNSNYLKRTYLDIKKQINTIISRDLNGK